MEIWIPDRIYIALPWVSITAASMIWFIPITLVSVTCSILLYAYGFWILLLRTFK